MILPTKNVSPARALITIASEIVLVAPPDLVTSGQLWERVVARRNQSGVESPLSFDWFVLALDVLFVLGLVSADGDLIRVEGTYAALAN